MVSVHFLSIIYVDPVISPKLSPVLTLFPKWFKYFRNYATWKLRTFSPYTCIDRGNWISNLKHDKKWEHCKNNIFLSQRNQNIYLTQATFETWIFPDRISLYPSVNLDVVIVVLWHKFQSVTLAEISPVIMSQTKPVTGGHRISQIFQAQYLSIS